MIGKNEVLLKKNDDWLHYSGPHKIIEADQVQHVREALREVEGLVNENSWHAAGFISYEAAPAFDNALSVLPSSDFPLLWFGLYPAPQIARISENSPGIPRIEGLQEETQWLSALNWQPTIPRQSYNTAIEKIKDTIASGKTYQVNYTMRLITSFTQDEWNFFLRLTQVQNKYAALLNTGRHVICSASPELFFKLKGENIISRPMKGTVKRGRTTQEDHQQIEWLRSSVKNRAENVMIVDMVRNDLGRIAEIGSVHVNELFTVEKYPTLFQMTSTVEARTKTSLTEIFSALFPCASITGAPKVSTMTIISELETTPRKIYTGSIGYISPNRDAQFNVAIRTALIDKENKQAEYGVGGGIVWDSINADEYDEALLKSRVLSENAQDFSLFETILWTPEEGYFLLEKHIARMVDSAEYFDFPIREEKLRNFLIQKAHKLTSAMRVKVFLNRLGELSNETIDFGAANRTLKVAVAKDPIDSGNVFLFHKTTHREIYPAPQAQNIVPGSESVDDLLLFNERNEFTEFTIGNLVVEIDDKFFTPPISSGLLAGTFRTHLLETNQIKERIIYTADLQKCSRLFLVNSIRKWVKAEIQLQPMPG